MKFGMNVLDNAGDADPHVRWLASLGGFTSSAAIVASAFRILYHGPLLPSETFGVGTIGWLAAGALTCLWRRRQATVG